MLGVGVGLGVGVSGVGVGLGVGVLGVGVGLGVGVSITVGNGADGFSAPEANNPMIAIAATMPIAMIHPPFFFFPGVLSSFCSFGFLLGFSLLSFFPPAVASPVGFTIVIPCSCAALNA